LKGREARVKEIDYFGQSKNSMMDRKYSLQKSKSVKLVEYLGCEIVGSLTLQVDTTTHR
jgi:hypothetical protein